MSSRFLSFHAQYQQRHRLESNNCHPPDVAQSYEGNPPHGFFRKFFRKICPGPGIDPETNAFMEWLLYHCSFMSLSGRLTIFLPIIKLPLCAFPQKWSAKITFRAVLCSAFEPGGTCAQLALGSDLHRILGRGGFFLFLYSACSYYQLCPHCHTSLWTREAHANNAVKKKKKLSSLLFCSMDTSGKVGQFIGTSVSVTALVALWATGTRQCIAVHKPTKHASATPSDRHLTTSIDVKGKLKSSTKFV